MKKSFYMLKIKTILLMIIFTLTGTAYAVKVPAGVKLAKEQVFRFNMPGVTTLDPGTMDAEPSFHIAKELYIGLVSQDAKGNIIPDLATSWQANSDNTVYTFNLRKGAQWSNGAPITAHDFVYSFRRLLNPKTASPYSWFVQIAEIKNSGKILKGKVDPSTLGVKALDDYTFQITLNSSVPFLVRLLSHPVLFPVHKDTVEKLGMKWSKPENFVGSGPFKLVSWHVNEKIVMEKNDKYWNADEVVLEKLIAYQITDTNTQYKRYEAGDIDQTSIPQDLKKIALSKYKDEIAYISPALGSWFNGFNMLGKIGKNLYARKALVYAINRDVLTKYVLGTGEIPLYSLSPPHVVGYKPYKSELEKMTQGQREEKAREFYKLAGYSSDKPLEMNYTVPNFSNDKKKALALIGMWKKVLGAKIKLDVKEAKAFYAIKRGGDFELIRGGWAADYNEASTFLGVLHSKGYNKEGYFNPEYDQLLDDAKVMADPSENYRKAEEILARDYPIIPLYRDGSTPLLLKKYVIGKVFTNTEANYYHRDIYILAH